MVRRVAAAQATLDRFNGKAFVWGRTDCVRLAAYALKAMGWSVPLAGRGLYTTEIGAGRALRRAGYRTLAEAVDGVGLPRIAPAAMLPADIVAMEDARGWLALGVGVGNGRILCVSEGRCLVAQLVTAQAAWRA